MIFRNGYALPCYRHSRRDFAGALGCHPIGVATFWHADTGMLAAMHALCGVFEVSGG